MPLWNKKNLLKSNPLPRKHSKNCIYHLYFSFSHLAPLWLNIPRIYNIYISINKQEIMKKEFDVFQDLQNRKPTYNIETNLSN